MNKKYFVLLISALFSASFSFAARMTVYNETDTPIQVKVYFGNQNLPGSKLIYAKGKQTFHSGIHAFNAITWHNFNTPKIQFQTGIPSTRTMLIGSFVIRNESGEYDINFNEKGQINPTSYQARKIYVPLSD